MDRSKRVVPTGNLLLDACPAPTVARLLPLLSRRQVAKGEVLASPHVPVEAVYFPLRSVISTVTQMDGGEAIEVGLAGREGMSALSMAFSSRMSAHTTVVQIADSAYCISAEDYLRVLHDDLGLRDVMRSYAEYSFGAATQFAACNRLHPIVERYARWLLMADDRMAGDDFTLTQENSAQMLGVRRAGVTVVAGQMSEAGIISYRRGRVTIHDRERLEEVACECYDAVNRELRRCMGYDIRHGANAVRRLEAS